MGDWSNERPKDVYGDLLHLDNAGVGVTSTLKRIEDGRGNDTCLELSNDALRLTGTLTVTGNASISGNLSAANLTQTYTATGTGAVSRTVASKLGEAISVKDFGATGDGVADDTAEIQAALTAAGAAGGGDVYLPPGTYAVSGTLLIGNGAAGVASTYNGVRLVGAGSAMLDSTRSPTTIKWVGATNYDGGVVKIAGRTTGCGVQGVYIDANDKARDGLVIRSNVGGRFEDILIQNFTRRGVDLGVDSAGASTWYSTSNVFERVHCITDNVSRTGFETAAWHISGVSGVADPHRNTFIGCLGQVYSDAESTGLPRALYLGYTDSSTFLECDFQRSFSGINAAGAVVAGTAGSPAGTGRAIVLDGTVRPDFPLNMFFYGCALIGGDTVTETVGVSEIGTIVWTNMTTRDNESPPTHDKIIGYNDRGEYFGDIPIRLRGDGNGMRWEQQDRARYWDARYDVVTGGTDSGLIWERTSSGTTTAWLKFLSTGEIEAVAGFRSFTATINDDAVATITPTRTEGTLSLMRLGGVTQNGIFAYDCVGTAQCVAMATGGSANVVASTGAHTGTTGTDGRLTVATHSDGNIYIENRTGGAITVRGTFLS